jgi:hypothetical protein
VPPDSVLRGNDFGGGRVCGRRPLGFGQASPKKTEVDSGKRAGVPTAVAVKLKGLERENRELRQANEIVTRPPSTWPVGLRVARKSTHELGTVVDQDGEIKVRWDDAAADVELIAAK